MTSQSKIPLNGLFSLALLYTLVLASDFLIPLAAAIIGALIFSAPRRALLRYGIPSFVTALFATTAMIFAIGYGTSQLAAPVISFVNQVPDLVDELRAQIGVKSGLVAAAEDAYEATQEMVSPESDTATDVRVVANSTVAGTILGFAPNILAKVGFGLCLMFFLISSGDGFATKIIESLRSFSDKRRALTTMRLIESRLGHYLGSITLINALLGLFVGFAMWIWGVPNAAGIGLMAMLLNFIPFLGAVIGAIVAGLIMFSQTESLWNVFGVFGTYMALSSLEGNFVTPMFLGRRLRLNATFVFLTVTFFAWIWSVVGMIMAVPLLIVVKTVCDEIESLSGIGRFLSNETEIRRLDPASTDT